MSELGKRAMPLEKMSRTLVLFDVDGTLTAPREEATKVMKDYLMALKERVVVGIVGGSDLPKQKEQMGENIVDEVDYSFSENGLVAYKAGSLIGKEVSTAKIAQLFGNKISNHSMGRLLHVFVAFSNEAARLNLCTFHCVFQTILSHLGEENCKALINFTLRYIADLDIPVKRYDLCASSISL